MNLSIFFDPIPVEVVSISSRSDEWQSNIKLFQETFPSWQEADIALIGITENRGTVSNKGVDKGANAVRKVLYQLKKGTGRYHICDLGNLGPGDTYEHTLLRLKEVCEILIGNNTIPVIIGGSHDINVGQYLAYEHSEKPLNFLNIDCKIDLEDSDDLSNSHLRKILTHEPNFLFHYSQLGHQSFLIDKEQADVLTKLNFELYRLGHVKENLEEIEPVVRTADMISFDISSIKISDAPANANAQPFGFTGEEACQICWYAGINSRISSFGVYEFNPELDNRDITARVIATMIWYFTEGFYHRNKEIDVTDDRFTKYIVALKEEPHKLVFYKDTLTEKWWMEVPYAETKSKYARNALVPCSYKDYKDAGKGEIPNRWIITHAKLS